MKSKAAAAGMEDIVNEVVQSEQTEPELVNGPSLEEIRYRAYEIHFEGGCVHGRDQGDWLQAERELMVKYRAR